MKRKASLVGILVLLVALGLVSRAQDPQAAGIAAPQAPLGTAFTYQGRLQHSEAPVSGTCDFRFMLYGSLGGNDPIGSELTRRNVAVSEGFFTVPDLDFGAGAFTGGARYLEIRVRCPAGSGTYALLSPRQELTAAPYALYALAGPFWSLGGNAGTDPMTHFLGTTDAVTMTLGVSGTAALRIEPAEGGFWGFSPNVIGGYGGNRAVAGAWAATIAGGGSRDYPNVVSEGYATVGGGRGNVASGVRSTVAGGGDNVASGDNATAGGGVLNEANGDSATTAGGHSNIAGSAYATVAGGRENEAEGYGAFVGGGSDHVASGARSTIGGGQGNEASEQHATVPGGQQAKASHLGEMAYASGSFDEAGDAQTSTYVLRIERTCEVGTWYDLYLDGNLSNPNYYLTIGSDRTVAFDALVVGRSDAAGGNQSAAYRLAGLVENVGGSAHLVNSSVQVIGEDDSTWSVRAAVLGDALFIQVYGNGETIRWVASVRTAEVAW